MNGVPRHMRYYVGNTGKNRRSKLKARLKRVVPDACQRAAVLAIMDEYAVLYHLKLTKE